MTKKNIRELITKFYSKAEYPEVCSDKFNLEDYLFDKVVYFIKDKNSTAKDVMELLKVEYGELMKSNSKQIINGDCKYYAI